MSRKLLAVMLGILLVSALSGTALAGNHGPIDLTIAAKTSRTK